MGNKKSVRIITWEVYKKIINIMIRTRMTQKRKDDSQISLITKSVDEISNIKVNWRTKYKLTNYSAICGSTENVEMHHVKDIRKGKVEGFLQVMNQLNRKQIPCCRSCHRNIHTAKYDGIGLNQIYDEELIII